MHVEWSALSSGARSATQQTLDAVYKQNMGRAHVPFRLLEPIQSRGLLTLLSRLSRISENGRETAQCQANKNNSKT